jgi:hypothetical protein
MLLLSPLVQAEQTVSACLATAVLDACLSCCPGGAWNCGTAGEVRHRQAVDSLGHPCCVLSCVSVLRNTSGVQGPLVHLQHSRMKLLAPQRDD